MNEELMAELREVMRAETDFYERTRVDYFQRHGAACL
jgi:hypothetical protein